ncbi:MAG: hypothetical protein KGH65_04400 [Candidatus Micrarchaeota archaeon]|nr:hypothetical protein [Candidatus Micrarchaeota archaeon]
MPNGSIEKFFTDSVSNLDNDTQNKLIEDLLKDKNLLKISDGEGSTVAHALGRSGNETVQMDLIQYGNEILKLVNKNGWSVAHEIGASSIANVRVSLLEFALMNDIKLLALADKNGLTVAHRLANGECSDRIGMEILQHKDILKLRTNYGPAIEYNDMCVADELAVWGGYGVLAALLDDKEALRLASDDGFSVAHRLGNRLAGEFGSRIEIPDQLHNLQMKLLQDRELLKLADKDGLTIAHELAEGGDENILIWLLKDKELLKIADKEGKSVLDSLTQNWNSDTDKLKELLENAKRESGV